MSWHTRRDKETYWKQVQSYGKELLSYSRVPAETNLAFTLEKTSRTNNPLIHCLCTEGTHVRLSPPTSRQVSKTHLQNLGLRHSQGASGLENQPNLRRARPALCCRYRQQDRAPGYRTTEPACSALHCPPRPTDAERSKCRVPAGRPLWLHEHIHRRDF